VAKTYQHENVLRRRLGATHASRHYDNEICVVARLSAQTVIGYGE